MISSALPYDEFIKDAEVVEEQKNPISDGPVFEFTPSSEQEVVILFGLLLPYLPGNYRIEEVRTGFPDCLASRIDERGDRSAVRIEFELLSGNFSLHRHDPAGCDLIVCWEDNLGSFPVPRLSLAPIARRLGLFVNDRPKFEKQTWDLPSFLGEVPPEQLTIQQDLFAWAATLGRIRFGGGSKLATWNLDLDFPRGRSIAAFCLEARGKAATGFLKEGGDSELEQRFRCCLAEVPSLTTKAMTSGWMYLDVADADACNALKVAVEQAVEELRSRV